MLQIGFKIETLRQLHVILSLAFLEIVESFFSPLSILPVLFGGNRLRTRRPLPAVLLQLLESAEEYHGEFTTGKENMQLKKT